MAILPRTRRSKRPSRRPNKCDKYGRASNHRSIHPGSGTQCEIVALSLVGQSKRNWFKGKKGAEMSDDSKPDQAQSYEDTLRSLILLTLPWLSFQRDMLEIAKNNITDPSHVRSTENFALRQLQALMMILDRSGTRRNLLDQNFEKRLGDAYKENLPKLTSASVQFIEAQEAILATVFDALNTLRKGDKAKSN